MGTIRVNALSGDPCVKGGIDEQTEFTYIEDLA
jgi:hypothetical protein